MARLLSGLVLAVCLLGAAASQAADVKTPFGSFVVPDGLTEVNREEKADPRTGKPAGMAVLARSNDAKAVFIVVWSYAEPDPAKPYDALEGAVRIGNPFDKSLTRDAAQAVQVGGVDGGRYEGKLPNGQRAVSYVAAHRGYRLVVLLKGPAGSPYKETVDLFGKGVEGFAWALPEPATATAPASAAR